MASEVMIPPWVLPESPETIRWLDDATAVFAPAFGRGFTQRSSFGDPRWGLRRRYRGLRSDQKAAILQCLNESRGQLNQILVTPHTPLRGSFPTGELLTNYTFENGTTGWTTSGEYTHAVTDRILRATRNAMTTNQYALRPSSNVTVVQYASYAMRCFVQQGKGAYANFSLDETVDAVIGATASRFGLLTQSIVPLTTSARPALNDQSTSGLIAGDYISIPYMSLSRCPQVDNRPSYLVRSDEIDNAAWTKSRSTITANAVVDPLGTSLADNLVEDNTSGQHYAFQAATVASAVADFSFCVAVKASGRNFVELSLQEGTGATSLTQYFNLSTGAVGSTGSTGVNWSNRRSSIVSLGNSWYLCCLVGRKTNAATTLNAIIIAATADGTDSYLGTSGAAVSIFRPTLAQSSFPTALRGTSTSSVPTGFTQTGSALTIKALPVSSNGLLEIGDWIEVAGQLKQVTARLNSDAAGLGYLQFRPALGDSPADSDPIIINQPFGRFVYSGQQKELENLFGIYGDIEMALEEVYA